jgi:aminoglycoside phosphotransferase (APT) family kinase protein
VSHRPERRRVLPETALVAVLEPVLSRPGDPAGIVRIERRPSPYRTSFDLEELDVHLDGGRILRLVLKDLSRQSLLEHAGRAKPHFLHDPLREIDVYQRLLSPRPHLGAPAFHGAVVDASLDRYWLLLERVAGVELYQVGDFETWKAVARWLAGLHGELAPLVADRDAAGPHLLHYGSEFLGRWITRARAFHVATAGRLPADRQRDLDRLADGYDRVIQRLLARTPTVIHGEFYASNILVQDTPAGLRICPVDWEMAAVGPPLLDVAALVSGNWTAAERRELALAYRSALPAAAAEAMGAMEAFLEDLDHCRLHLAVQWLGWSADWTPPPEHARDWLGEALALAERLGFLATTPTLSEPLSRPTRSRP